MNPLEPIRRLDRLQQHHPVLAVPCATVRKFGDDRGGNLVALLAYYAFLSVFPLLLVFTTVLGYLLAGNPSLEKSVSDSVLGTFPVIGSSINHDNLAGSGVALAIGLALALLSGLAVTASAHNAFDTAWEVPRRRRPNFITSKLRGVVLLVVLGVMFVVASGASGIVSSGIGGGGEAVMGVAVSLTVNFGLFVLSYQLLCTRQIGWLQLLPGAAVAAILLTILQLLGGTYVARIAHTSSAYGTFALVIGVIAWLHLGASVTVYCAELNAVLARREWPRSLLGPDNQVVPRRDGKDERELDRARSLSYM